MKHLAVILCIFALPASAETWGIRFDQMPIGCRVHRAYHSGEHEITEYIGRSTGGHVMKTYRGPAGTALLRTTTYSFEGLRIRTDGADGTWATYSPAMCDFIPGQCSYVYRTSSGLDQKYEGHPTMNGRELTSIFSAEGDSQRRTFVAVLGRFNLPQTYREGDVSVTITKYENCDAILGS